MAQFPGMLLWTDAWVADTHHLHYADRGLYHDLLVLMWRTPGCRVPNDDAWLGARMRLTPAEIKKRLRPLIREFCRTDGNWIIQKRLQKEFLRAVKIGERMSVLRKRLKSKAAKADTSRLTLRLEREIESYSGEIQRSHPVDKSPTEGVGPEEAGDKKAKPSAELIQPSTELIQLVTGKQPREG